MKLAIPTTIHLGTATKHPGAVTKQLGAKTAYPGDSPPIYRGASNYSLNILCFTISNTLLRVLAALLFFHFYLGGKNIVLLEIRFLFVSL